MECLKQWKHHNFIQGVQSKAEPPHIIQRIKALKVMLMKIQIF